MNRKAQKETKSKSMSSLAPTSPISKNTCAHCGREMRSLIVNAQQNESQSTVLLPDSAESIAAEAALLFCCKGCEQVFAFLQNGNLTKYYDLLKNLAAQPPDQARANQSSFSSYDHPAIRSLFERKLGELAIFIPSLRCAACIWLIETVLLKASGVLEARVNLLERRVYVSGQSDKMSLTQMCELLQNLGYQPFPPQIADWNETQKGLSRAAAKNLAIAGALFANVMMLATGLYFGDLWGIDENMRHFFMVIMAILGTLAFFFPGAVFFKSAWNALKVKKLHMDLPISFALLVTYITSMIGFVQKSNLIYFDSLSGLIFFLLCARSFHEHLLSRARRLASYASSLLPEKALLMKPGDEVWVALGEHFPADGTILEGQTEINEAALTGESKPVKKSAGQDVFAGTQNTVSAVLIKVTRCGADSFVGNLMRTVDRAKSQKSAFQVASEKVLPYFMIFTMASAAGAAIFWLFRDPSKALAVASTVLIVACPCAIALAVPLTLADAMKTAWKKGFVIKGSDVLEKLTKVDAFVLDKTGTLTSGEMKVTEFYGENIQKTPSVLLLGAALSLAKRSAHPASRAIVRYFKSNQIVLDQSEIWDQQSIPTHETPGLGMSGDFVGLGLVKLGSGSNLDLTQFPKDFKEGETQIYLSTDKETYGFSLKDSLRKGVLEFLMDLLKKNKEVHVATGDKIAVAKFLSESLLAQGLQTEKIHWHAELNPEQKLALVEKLKCENKQVAMVGDGVNDAPSLARADIGLAIGGGIDVALNACDVFYLQDDLYGIVQLIAFSEYVKNTLTIVIAISILYNLLAVGFACVGVLHPLIAAAIMPLSSISTVAIVSLRKGDSLWMSCTFSSQPRSSLQRVDSASF